MPECLRTCRDQKVCTLSGGEQRLVEVEFMLGLERDYVLLDEPFTGVEPILIDAIGQHIKQAAATGTGILLADHDHQHVIPLAEEAYVLWHKQCYPLDSDASIHDQLVTIGSLREEAPSPS